MSWNQNIPQPTDMLSQSQPQLLGDFQSIQTLIDVNHVDFANANQGKHFFIELPAQTIIPVTVAAEVGLYSQTSAITMQPELVFSKQSGTSVVEFTSAGLLQSGWVYQPSGVLFKWGQSSGNGTVTVILPTTDGGGQTIPAFNNPINLQVTAWGNGTVYVVSFTKLQFVVQTSANIIFQYFMTGN
jgi:hypothetical protein